MTVTAGHRSTTHGAGATRQGSSGPDLPRASSWLRTSFLGHPVLLAVTDAPGDALTVAAALLRRLEELWDAGQRRSDLHRVLVRPGTVVPVSAETVLLARHAAEAQAFTGVSVRDRLDVVVSSRHGCVGLPPVTAARAGSLVVPTAVDLVAERLAEAGAGRGLVRIGSSTRAVGTADAPAWQVPLPLLPAGCGVQLAEGGLATSAQAPVRLDRLATVRPGSTRDAVAAVAVMAPNAWEGAVLAEAALSRDTDAAVRLLERSGAGALVVPATGGLLPVGPAGPFATRGRQPRA